MDMGASDGDGDGDHIDGDEGNCVRKEVRRGMRMRIRCRGRHESKSRNLCGASLELAGDLGSGRIMGIYVGDPT